VKTSSHSLGSVVTSFDASGLVADAGLLLPASLAEYLGLPQLVDRHVRLGKTPGAAHPGQKAMTVVASLLAGGDCIDDVGALGAGATGGVLGHHPAAASTVGTFLRAFSAGHAPAAGCGDRERAPAGLGRWGTARREVLKIDLDSSVVETYGLQKQGGSEFTYLRTRGYHPLFAIVAGHHDVLHCRLRAGKANTARGAGGFVRQSLARLGRNLVGVKEVVVRADTGFYLRKVVEACQHHRARFSIGVRLQSSHHKLIAEIPDAAWRPIPYWREGSAAVAEAPYRPFGGKRAYRLIVRRVEPSPGSQLHLAGVLYRYHALITDREGEMLELEADHRQHAEIETVIRDLKYGLGLNHMPSGKFGANAAWLALNALAHNLSRWLGRLGGLAPQCLKTMRRRLFAVPARLARSGRRVRLRLPARWPWRREFETALGRIRTLVPLTT
jgi:hypothetical protein